jgi:hypothetical protein
MKKIIILFLAFQNGHFNFYTVPAYIHLVAPENALCAKKRIIALMDFRFVFGEGNSWYSLWLVL